MLLRASLACSVVAVVCVGGGCGGTIAPVGGGDGPREQQQQWKREQQRRSGGQRRPRSGRGPGAGFVDGPGCADHRPVRAGRRAVQLRRPVLRERVQRRGVRRNDTELPRGRELVRLVDRMLQRAVLGRGLQRAHDGVVRGVEQRQRVRRLSGRELLPAARYVRGGPGVRREPDLLRRLLHGAPLLGRELRPDVHHEVPDRAGGDPRAMRGAELPHRVRGSGPLAQQRGELHCQVERLLDDRESHLVDELPGALGERAPGDEDEARRQLGTLLGPPARRPPCR